MEDKTIENRMSDDSVPSALRRWFIMHFAIDVIIATPLFIVPELLFSFGWVLVDPIATRLAAAALFGIGLESWLGRNATIEAYRGMLQLKLIWSGFAAIGIAWSVIQGAVLYPWVGWSVVGIFVAFHLLWWYWWARLRQGSVRTY